MGVHTLGRARGENSPFHGWWSDPVSSKIFNNNYYISLAAKGWMPDGNRQQWKRAGNRSGQADEMMLNTDMCLLYENKGTGGGRGVLKVEDFSRNACCAWIMPM